MARSRDNLRSGFTTGACAAAATKGALSALVHQCELREAAIRLPDGQVVRFVLHSCGFSDRQGWASVIKDAGDDPDVTHGAEICSRVTWNTRGGVHFLKGDGVGLVTKKGLPVPPGEPAINPVPRAMIGESVAEVLAEVGAVDSGVDVGISVPGGEALARKTFNPRLGIIGGISILGTTGIVVPYSTEAWLASVIQGIDVAVAQDCFHLIMVVGASGERFARHLFDLPDVAYIQIGPFFGAALRHAAGVGVKRVSLLAMAGKLAKFAAGNESVHSQDSTQDFGFLAAIARATGADENQVQLVLASNTAQEASDLLDGAFHDLVCRRAWEFARSLSAATFDIDVYLTDRNGTVRGMYPR
jgi:cobalt-precorrin-5B (C1)-methyltransferase